MAEGSIAADELRALIERIERLEEEKRAMADDIRDVYAEAKARGYDAKAMRVVIALLILSIWLFVKWQRALQLLADAEKLVTDTQEEVEALQAALGAWSGFRVAADE